MLRLVLVWWALMGLLAATIGAMFIPLGAIMPLVSYGIAAVKTGLVFWFFMNMRSELPLARLFGLAGFIWFVFLATLVAADILTRPSLSGCWPF